MNPTALKSRSAIIKLIRAFFDARGYTEVHTPRLVGLPGQEPYLEPFATEVIEANGAKHSAALITSPEYAMKRLLAAGMDQIYDLGPCFRNNEPWDGTHDPEFLMIEWYRKSNKSDQLSSRTSPAGDGGSLSSLMDETEEMVKWVAGRFGWSGGQGVFRRMTCADAWKTYANVDLVSLIGDREAMAAAAREHGQTVNDTDTWDDLYYKVFLTKIEPKLGEEPTFLYRYPVSQAALAKTCTDDSRFADRVELYIGGMELANGFAELADATEQRKRFEEDQKLRASTGKNVWPIDEKFLSALPAMGEAVGIAFGIDRFVMLLTGAKSINDVVPFSARERFER